MLDSLFTPFTCRSLTVPNRWVMAPMTRGQSPQTIPGPQVAEYYRRRAAGGVGLIISEGTLVPHPLAANSSDLPSLSAEAIAGWREVIKAVHAEGGKIICQLWHQGSKTQPGLGPIPVFVDGKQVVRKAVDADLDDLKLAFVKAACAAREAGFDGVELHAAHGYLLDSYMRCALEPEAADFSQRERTFVQEVVREVRQCVGPDYFMVLRFSQWKLDNYDAHYIESLPQLEQLLNPLRDAGVDVFHASTRRFWLPAFSGTHTLAGNTRQVTGRPVIAVGSVGLDGPNWANAVEGNPAVLERVVQEESLDFIALGRILLADPEFVNKVRANRLDEIQPLTQEAFKAYP
ncbi:MAG: 12-oxophytodienoate reductase [Verrucomicrobiota bacterium]|nr:12-oxophytodienoate reductase [Verrucomicrobiota bacterium]